MADLSSSSNLMALEGLPEDLRKGIHEKFFLTVIKIYQGIVSPLPIF
jgi:hypothetical protein